jgi:hypothetical protein
MLYNLGVITFSPPLESRIRKMEVLKSGESWEMQLRGCSIWAVEMIRRQIVQEHPEAESEVNAVLLDFLLYDLAKEFESTGTFRACGLFAALSRSTDFKVGVQSMWRSAGYTNTSNERRTQAYPQANLVMQVQRASRTTEHGAYGTRDVMKRNYINMAVCIKVHVNSNAPSLFDKNLLPPFVLFVCGWVHTRNRPFTHQLSHSLTGICAGSLPGLASPLFQHLPLPIDHHSFTRNNSHPPSTSLSIEHFRSFQHKRSFSTVSILTNSVDAKSLIPCVHFW